MNFSVNFFFVSVYICVKQYLRQFQSILMVHSLIYRIYQTVSIIIYIKIKILKTNENIKENIPAKRLQ